MSLALVLDKKNANKEWTFAMVQYALNSLARYHTMDKSKLSNDRKDAVERDIEHYKNDYDKYSPLLKWNSKYKRGLKQ